LKYFFGKIMASVLSLYLPLLGLASTFSATPKNSHSRLSAIATIDFESLLQNQKKNPDPSRNVSPRVYKSSILLLVAFNYDCIPKSNTFQPTRALILIQIPSRWLASVPRCRNTPPHLSTTNTNMIAQYQLGHYPRDDASIQEDSHGRSQCPAMDSNRLPCVELDHRWYLRLHALLDQQEEG
jgi:hypothetical protein